MTKKSNSFKDKFQIIATLSLLVLALFAYAMPASAATTAAGANNNLGAGVLGQNLANIVITSNLAGDIDTNGIFINLPVGAGVTFNTASVPIAVRSAGVTVQVGPGPVTISPTQIFVPINVSAGAANDAVTVSNIKVDVTSAVAIAPNITILTAGSPNGVTLTLLVVQPVVTQTVAISLLAGANGQGPFPNGVRLTTTNGVSGEIGAGTTVSLTLPANSGVTFDKSTPGTVFSNVVTLIPAEKPANISADGLTLFTQVTGASTPFGNQVTFRNFRLNTTATVNNTFFSMTIVTTNGVTVTTPQSGVPTNITTIKPTLAMTATRNIARGGTQQLQAGSDITVTTTAIGQIGAGTAISLTLPANSGVTFDKSNPGTVSSNLNTVIVGVRPANVSADGLTLSINANASNAVAVEIVTFTGFGLNATNTAASSANLTLTTTATGGTPITSPSAGNDILVFQPAVSVNTTILLDLDGIVMFNGTDIAITTPTANGLIGNVTMISVTLPAGGITFDQSSTVTVTGTGNLAGKVSTPANLSADGKILSTNTTAASLAGDSVTFSNIRYNATAGATTANPAITTTANGTGAQSVTNTTQQIVIQPITADNITNISASSTQAAGSTATYKWHVQNNTNAAQVDGFGGQLVTFTTTAGTLGVPSATTGSDGNVSVNLTTTTGATLNASIAGCTVGTCFSTITVTVPAGPATKLAVFPDVARVAGSGTATITVKAQDQFGNNNTAFNTTIQLLVTGDTIFLSGNPAPMTNGVATFTIRKATPGSTILTAIDTTVLNPLTQATGTQLFVPDIGGIVLTATPASLSATGQVATLTAQLKDAAGNNLALPGQTVTFASNNTTLATVGILSALTDVAGVATSNLTANALSLTGTVMVNASVTNASAVTFTNTSIVQITTPGFINGTVTNATTGVGEPNVSVTAGGVTNLTNATGFYSISLAAGTYNVTASKVGFATNTTAGVVVTSGATTTLNIALQSTGVPGFINGTVTNATSALSEPGVNVSAGGITVLTDAAGLYSISLAAGTYTVTASKAGFTTNTTAGVVVNAGATTTQNIALQPLVGVLGDVNGNGALDVGDGLFTLQAVAGTRTLTAAQTALADVNHNGALDVGDGLFTLQAVAGARILV